VSSRDVEKIAEVVERKKEVVTHLKEEVMNMANSELQKPNITADEVENITAIKDDAVAVAQQAAEILASGMEAAQALLS
jgi:NADH dehydrogenase FAD-containing subunit